MKSLSQNGQEDWVLSVLNNKKNGYFVDFGACDGLLFSNSYVLENDYNWQGIVCEPDKKFHAALFKNRKCDIDVRCVYARSKAKMKFISVTEFEELSTLEVYSFIKDEFFEKRKNNTTYEVETISLLDLLKEYNAPKTIDYLSIDTEGSEYDILNAFDFSAYDIRTITVEHNWTENRQKIYNLLSAHGYKRVHTEKSKWDDWYMKE